MSINTVYSIQQVINIDVSSFGIQLVLPDITGVELLGTSVHMHESSAMCIFPRTSKHE